VKSLIMLATLVSVTSFHPTHASSDLNTNFIDHYGHVGTRMSIQCNSRAVITNNDARVHKYLVGTRICAQNKDCKTNEGWIQLEAGKKFNNSYQTVLLTTFNRVGKKDLDCTNYVSGDEQKSQMLHAYAYIN
jgi:hypothetical protein